MSQTILSPYISDGEINLPKDKFLTLDPDAVKDAFVTEVLENHSIALPVRKVTEQEAIDDFRALC